MAASRFQKRSQLFIGMHNKPLSVVAMCGAAIQIASRDSQSSSALKPLGSRAGHLLRRSDLMNSLCASGKPVLLEVIMNTEDSATKKDLEGLQGTWSLVSAMETTTPWPGTK